MPNAVDRATYFVLGCSNLVSTVDHNPLPKIFVDRSLDQISNPTLCILKEKTLRYHFRIVHIPGAEKSASDAILRHPTGDLMPTKMQLSDDIFHIALPPTFKIPLQLLASIHLEDQHLSDDMENSLNVFSGCSITGYSNS